MLTRTLASCTAYAPPSAWADTPTIATGTAGATATSYLASRQ